MCGLLPEIPSAASRIDNGLILKALGEKASQNPGRGVMPKLSTNVIIGKLLLVSAACGNSRRRQRNWHRYILCLAR
jgi:hypothetical protein